MTVINEVSINIQPESDSEGEENAYRDRKVRECVQEAICGLGLVASATAGALCFYAERDEAGTLLVAAACAMFFGYWFFKCEPQQPKEKQQVLQQSLKR